MGVATILIVDDEPSIRYLMARVLAPHGYAILETGYPLCALEFCELHPDPIDLLISDVFMPEMRGPDLASQALLLRPEMRVLYMSGAHEGVLRREVKFDQDVPLLRKPFAPADLLEKVRAVLDADLVIAEPCVKGRIFKTS